MTHAIAVPAKNVPHVRVVKLTIVANAINYFNVRNVQSNLKIVKIHVFYMSKAMKNY